MGFSSHQDIAIYFRSGARGKEKASLRLLSEAFLSYFKLSEFFLTLYYQNTKVGGKNCQLSLSKLGCKWDGMWGCYFGFWVGA
jgi:hypothetical protein